MVHHRRRIKGVCGRAKRSEGETRRLRAVAGCSALADSCPSQMAGRREFEHFTVGCLRPLDECQRRRTSACWPLSRPHKPLEELPLKFSSASPRLAPQGSLAPGGHSPSHAPADRGPHASRALPATSPRSLSFATSTLLMQRRGSYSRVVPNTIDHLYLEFSGH